MREYVVRRLLLLLPQILVLTIISFGITRIAPGDPTAAFESDQMATVDPRYEENLRIYLGLDRPLHIQYWDWLSHAVRLDFGRSFVNLSMKVSDLLRQRMGPTMLLAGTALIICTLGGILIGIVAARWHNTLLDHGITFLAFFFLAVPSFWAGILAITFFAIRLHWFPTGGLTYIGQPMTFVGVLKHLTLPAIVLGLRGMASNARYVRSGLIEVMAEDYIRTARAKGLAEWTVFGRHALRNVLLPVVTLTALRLPSLVGGSVLIERVFSWPGLGMAAVDAANARDYPVTMTLVLFTGTLTILGNLLADVVYGVLDPRIRE